MRDVFLDVIKSQGFSNIFLPNLNLVKHRRWAIDLTTKETLGLKPIMGAPSQESSTAADDCVDCEDDQPTSAVACCKNCAKIMCAKHVDIHSKLKSCRNHVVVPIAGTKRAVSSEGGITASLPPARYNRPSNMIGCAFDFQSMIKDGMKRFWPQISIRREQGLPLCLRITVDGAKLTDSKNFCTGSIRWLVKDINPEVAEWLLVTVECEETLENMIQYFSSLLKEAQAMNDVEFMFTPEGSTSSFSVPIKIFFCPDAKMLNVSTLINPKTIRPLPRYNLYSKILRLLPRNRMTCTPKFYDIYREL